MHLPTVILAVLSFGVTSVLGADGDPNMCDDNDPSATCIPFTGVTPADGSVTFCNQPNQQGACTAPTMWEDSQCLRITDPDKNGIPGSSFKVTGDGGVCMLWASNVCNGANSGSWVNSFNNPIKSGRKYRTFRCQSASNVAGKFGQKNYDITLNGV